MYFDNGSFFILLFLLKSQENKISNLQPCCIFWLRNSSSVKFKENKFPVLSFFEELIEYGHEWINFILNIYTGKASPKIQGF